MLHWIDMEDAHIYFIGIGGIGMSALARWFKAQGWAVSGSDAARNEITDALRKEGMQIAIGHKKSNINRHIAVVVYNRAIARDNPEILTAKKMHIPAVTYAKVLGKITEKYQTIAITGSHGKTTTTALAGLTLLRGGLDPTVLIGTNLKEFGGRNIHAGKSKYFVIEADDFGGAFWHYSPAYAIITNIDREHLDFYKNFAGVKHGFLKFISRIRRGGTLILNRDDAGISNLKSQISKTAEINKVKVIWYSLKNREAAKIKMAMRIPGMHNVSNALAAYALGSALHIPEKKILAAIHAYRGSWRRMEYKGTYQVSGIRCRVYDDYAHHPTEIKATLGAFREKYPHSPLVCVYQPHQAARLKALFKEFQSAFADADIALILLAYNPMGRDLVRSRARAARPRGAFGRATSNGTSSNFDSLALVRAIQKREPKKRIFYLADLKNLKKALHVLVPPIIAKRSSLTPILIMMGAGNIAEETKKLLVNKK